MSEISVVVPMYQASKYLRVCVDSILEQTYEDFELILVDDGSTDGCYEICEEYKQRDFRIRVLHKRNEGLVRARKDGLRLAKGKYLFYVDSDDWIEKDTLECMHKTLVSQGVDIVIAGRYEDTGNACVQKFPVLNEGRYNKNALENQVYPMMIAGESFFEWGVFPAVWDKMYRKELLEKYQMEVDDSITMGEDAACTYPCMLNADSLYVLHKCFYHYRQTTSSMSKNNADSAIERKNFNVLYNSVNEKLACYNPSYNLNEQWKRYVLFMMVPRAGYLHENIEKLEYLFPYPRVKKGSSVIIYGMGTYGQLLYGFFERTGFCHVVATADRNYMELQKLGIKVIAPHSIDVYDFDAIIVANSFAKNRNAIYEELVERFSEDKVHVMDVEMIMRDETMLAFGLK